MAAFAQLPEREQRVLKLLAEGKAERAIAKRLAIPKSTVHRIVVMAKQRLRDIKKNLG